MKYVIIQWDNDNLKWVVVHYSHDLKDVKRMWEKYKKLPNCHMMVDFKEAIFSRRAKENLDYLNKLLSGELDPREEAKKWKEKGLIT